MSSSRHDFDDGDFVDLPEITDEELAALHLEGSKPPPDNPKPNPRWLPTLTQKQMEVFMDKSMFLLIPGNRYSGKGWSSGYCAVRHTYDYHNALVLIVVRSKRQALAGGVLQKLYAEILPDFKKNIKGFTFRGPRVTQEKDIVLEVLNRYGTWSTIQLMSILHDSDIERKVKGIEASLVVVDEITLFDNEDLFSQLSNTLGRRNHIPPAAQRFVATCNPTDPDHWVYQKWFVQEKDNPQFRVIKIHKEDNPDPKCIDYYKRLEATLRNDRTRYQRDVLGLWVKAPSGQSLFGRNFVSERHVKGDLATGELIHPKAGVRITLGIDIGDTNHGIVFMQERITKDKTLWVPFDEVSYVGKQVAFRRLTREIMEKMQFWCETVNYDFLFEFISDRSAFDRFRATTGSFDHLEIQKHSAELLPEFPRLKKPIKMLECPKPQGSVASRTRILQDLIEEDRFFVSAKCKALIDMINNITGTKDNPQVPDTHSPYKHMYDAVTYPLFYHGVGGSVVAQTADAAPKIQPMAMAIG